MKSPFYGFSAKRITGQPVSMETFENQVLLVVNVASQCGLTPQYEALEKIQKTYVGRGFQVLGFPANEFLAQEPGTNAEIEQFCTTKFHVSFPMFEKIVAKGPGQHPLYAWLTKEHPQAIKTPGSDFEGKLREHGLVRENPSDILWNFEKFLIGRNGKIVARFTPDTAPDSELVTKAIDAELAK
jgi:glutathione peroxidase